MAGVQLLPGRTLHGSGLVLRRLPSIPRLCPVAGRFRRIEGPSIVFVKACSDAGNASSSAFPEPGFEVPNKEVAIPAWKKWQSNAADMRAQVAKLGLAAVLAYGLFDGVTYTTFFFLAFLGYEKSTGNNPAANIQALLGIVITMWAGNNVTRPFRVAGAAAIAPVVDRFLKKVQKVLKLPNQAFAFMLVVASFASLCLSLVGLLILSRWGR